MLEVAKTVARIFAAELLLGIIAALGQGLGVWELDMAVWKPIIVAAAIPSLTVLVNALNPKDTRYGLNASAE